MASAKLKPIIDKDLIVFLVAYGLDIKEAEKDGNRSRIYFEDTPYLKDAILKYTNRSVKINISDYIAAEKRVKTLLYTQKYV